MRGIYLHHFYSLSYYSVNALVEKVISHHQHEGVENVYRMPKFSPDFAKRSREIYQLKFLTDGYPGRLINGKIEPHPLYGTFVLRDYLTQYEQKRDPRVKEAIMRVCDAAIARMKPYRGALVFWYAFGTPFNHSSKSYYSGLTQSHYAALFAQVYQITGKEEYKVAAKKIYKSLLIPQKRGGVFYRSTKGPSVQELPMHPNGYVLNGWLTILSNIKNYARIFNDRQANKFWAENVSCLKRLLPLYDLPKVANSRYTLNGPAAIELHVPVKDIEIKDVRLKIPGEGVYHVPVTAPKHSWSHYISPQAVKKKAGKLLFNGYDARINVLLSRFSYPSRNKLLITLVSKQSTSLSVKVAHGDFLATSNRQQNQKYTVIGKRRLKKGSNHIEIGLPWKLLGLIGYPTTFKKIGDAYYNNYHFIHIVKLEELYRLTGDQIFREYARKWKSYVKRWSNMAAYRGMQTQPYKYARFR
ncbi:D-glucuronyl C5-epimerase family protein [Paenibacillus xerothermodurans]|uniref:D-glucuronyl C5-epimerase C-terminal domain-containing protein n=1 Tax=Paenibacillus xerothermodurans TaxID=1977292 RepID=A0A2W1NTR3_PAEXE|nr:D-glucuronyl C5-epimerase family protein [Paenibacillus xerothermodurans]PZE21136.1 hypothetical protein CBW46_010695 [Paenibacillus xerothermodurans]